MMCMALHCDCVCVFVYVCESEREGEISKEFYIHCIYHQRLGNIIVDCKIILLYIILDLAVIVDLPDYHCKHCEHCKHRNHWKHCNHRKHSKHWKHCIDTAITGNTVITETL